MRTFTRSDGSSTADQSLASTTSQYLTTLRRTRYGWQAFKRTFAVAIAATGITLGLFIVMLNTLYQQYGARTLI